MISFQVELDDAIIFGQWIYEGMDDIFVLYLELDVEPFDVRIPHEVLDGFIFVFIVEFKEVQLFDLQMV